MFGVCVWRSVWRGMLWRLFVVMGQHKVWRSVWRGMLWRLFVVMRQHNVWCVCVATHTHQTLYWAEKPPETCRALTVIKNIV